MKKRKIPWPTRDVMQQIYDRHLWGGKEFDFYSGDGSHNPRIINPYLKAVTQFLKEHHSNLTICDLGCGDFNVGRRLVTYTKKYFAIDIVKNLIARNKELFKVNNLKFECLDIAKDDIPKCDCVVLRQVLQHLSNKEINQIIEKIRSSKYLILTEHIPIGDFIPNKDIISGQGNRLKHNSGVDLTKVPFNLQVSKETVLNEVILDDNKGRITTKLYELN